MLDPCPLLKGILGAGSDQLLLRGPERNSRSSSVPLGLPDCIIGNKVADRVQQAPDKGGMEVVNSLAHSPAGPACLPPGSTLLVLMQAKEHYLLGPPVVSTTHIYSRQWIT